LPRRSTVTRSAISSTSRSLWVMKMTETPSAVRSQDLEQLGVSCAREHRRRLVEDQHVRAAVQRAQDLDALLLADADVLDARARVDRRPEALRQLAHPLARPPMSSSAALRGSDAEDEVLGQPS
jgi:hypothetical protein